MCFVTACVFSNWDIGMYSDGTLPLRMLIKCTVPKWHVPPQPASSSRRLNYRIGMCHSLSRNIPDWAIKVLGLILSLAAIGDNR